MAIFELFKLKEPDCDCDSDRLVFELSSETQKAGSSTFQLLS